MFKGCEACAKYDGFKCTNDSFYLKKGYWWKWENETNKENFISFRDALRKNSSVEKKIPPMSIHTLFLNHIDVQDRSHVWEAWIPIVLKVIKGHCAVSYTHLTLPTKLEV